MKRKILFLNLLIICIFFLCGCEKQDDVETGMETIAEIYDETYVDVQNDAVLEIIYPQIKKNSDKINQILKESAFDYSEYISDFTLEDLSIWVDYEVKLLNEKYASILFKGSVYKAETAYPTNFCFAVTVDIEKGTVMKPSDYISKEDIRKKLDAEQYTVTEGAMRVYTAEEIKKEFYEEAISEYMENENLFYIEEGSVYFIVNGFSHAMGDYSIISFPV